MASSPERSLVLDSVRTVLLDAPSGAAPGGPAPVPLPASERSWVAFSGGVDSTVLLDAAARVLGGRSAEGLAAVHVNHGLYPDAGAWEDHCREAAARLGIRLEVRRAVVRASPGGGNLEAAAPCGPPWRDRGGGPARRAGPSRPPPRRPGGDGAHAHPAGRGTGGDGGQCGGRSRCAVCGWCGRSSRCRVRRSSPMRGNAGSRGSRTPETPRRRNDRNHVRRRVLPVVAERWPGAAATLVRLARRSEETAAMLDALGAADLADAKGGAPGTLNAAAIAALPPPRAANALRTWLLARHRIPPPPRRWLRVLAEEVAAAGSDRRPEAVRAGIWVRRYRGELHTGREGAPPRLPESTGWRIDGEPLESPPWAARRGTYGRRRHRGRAAPPFRGGAFPAGRGTLPPPRARCHQAAQAPDAGARCSPLGTRGVAPRIRRRPYRRGSGTLRLRALRRARRRAGLAPRVDPPPAGRYPFPDHVAQADALSCRATYRLPPPGAPRGMNGGSLRTGME